MGLAPLVLLASLFAFSSSETCNKTIYVLVTGSGDIELPIVAETILSTDRMNLTWFNVTEDGAELLINRSTMISVPSINATYQLTNEALNDTVITVTLSFIKDRITCRDIIMSRPLVLPAPNISFTCIPVSSCGSGDPGVITSIKWKKAYILDNDTNEHDEYDELVSGNFSGNLVNNVDFHWTDDRISISTEEDVNNSVLTLFNLTFRSAGYYIAVDGATGDYVLNQFTLFYGPVVVVPTETTSIKINVNTNNYSDVECVFRSFPNSMVTWFKENVTVDGQQNFFFNFSNLNAVPNETLFDFTYTIDGELVIRQVSYDDAATYYCNASNGFNKTSNRRRLRVRDPLSPLWPILGTIASFVITAVCILSGMIVEKIRGEPKNTLSEEEIDGAFRTSVSSIEDETKQHGVYRRDSSLKDIKLIS